MQKDVFGTHGIPSGTAVKQLIVFARFRHSGAIFGFMCLAVLSLVGTSAVGCLDFYLDESSVKFIDQQSHISGAFQDMFCKSACNHLIVSNTLKKIKDVFSRIP